MIQRHIAEDMNLLQLYCGKLKAIVPYAAYNINRLLFLRDADCVHLEEATNTIKQECTNFPDIQETNKILGARKMTGTRSMLRTCKY
jgi:hypothetical protein